MVKMRKIQALLVVLIAAFAFSAVAAASAMAFEWFVEERPFVALDAETEMSAILLTTLEGNLELSMVDCSALAEGSLTSPTSDEVTTILNLSDELIGNKPLEKLLALSCEVTGSEGGAFDCELNTLAEVWPDNLPWLSSMELMANEQILDVVTKEPGYYVLCKTPLGTFSELCAGNTSVLLENEPLTTPASILVEANAESEKSNCALLGNGKGDNEGIGNLWATEGTLVRLATSISLP